MYVYAHTLTYIYAHIKIYILYTLYMLLHDLYNYSMSMSVQYGKGLLHGKRRAKY